MYIRWQLNESIISHKVATSQSQIFAKS